MLNVKVQATTEPPRVTMETLPDGRTSVRLRDNVVTLETEDGTVYEYDEVVFDLPEDRTETVESIEQAFSGWWAFGQQADEVITLEQRVSDLEEMILSMLEE